MAGKRNPNSPEDRFLPIANVSRMMKKSLPANAKISKEAKESLQQCVSEFISFVTGEASDKCQREKRKTINGDDLLWAMTTLGFHNYVAPLKEYLSKYRDTAEGDNVDVNSDDSEIYYKGSLVYTLGMHPLTVDNNNAEERHLGYNGGGNEDDATGMVAALPAHHHHQW
ncbi:Nuclear transcription factor Y subunit B-11 [Linum perenne]